MVKTRLIVGATMVLLLAPVGAQAAGGDASVSTVSAPDPEDVESRLDMVFVEFRGHGDGNATLTIRTAEKWGCRYLRFRSLGDYSDGRAAFLAWQFNTDQDAAIEKSGGFNCTDAGKLIFDVNHSDERFPTSRPNRRTVKVVLPLRSLGLAGRNLTLTALSRVNGVYGSHIFLDEEDLSPTLRP